MVNFTQISNAVAQLSTNELSSGALNIYVYMASLPKDWHFKIYNIAKAKAMSVGSVVKYIAELENLGLISKTTRRGRNIGSETIYSVNLEIPKNEIPKNEIPKNEIPKFEIPKNEIHTNTIDNKYILDKKEVKKETLDKETLDKGESEKSLSAKSPELENEVSKPKSKFAKLSAKECIAYVTELYNQLEVKPKGDFETFCEWLKCKAGKKGLLEYVIKRDFECYQRLDLLTAESPNDRLNRALQGGKNGVYQSLKFDSDNFTGGGYRGVELKHNAKNVNDNFSVTQTQRDLFAKPKYSFSSDKIAKFDNRQKKADGGEKC